MKLAWICYNYDVDGEFMLPTIVFEEPSSLRYDKIIPIVYAQIIYNT